MQDPNDGGKLAGEVEVDETYIGGAARNMHNDRRRKSEIKQGGSGKAIVIGALERGKRVRATVVPNRKKPTIRDFVRDNVKLGTNLFLDEHAHTRKMDDKYVHKIVNHLET